MLTNDKLIDWLTLFADELIANKAYLSDLDSPIGDGDHGVNMARGATFLKEAFSEKQPQNISETLKLTGMTLLSKVGGASGPLYGSAFIEMSKVTEEKLNSEALITNLKNGMTAVGKRGKSTVGEKTMLDVWDPVIKSLEKNELSSEAITTFVDKTKDILATKGRAAFLGERSIGHIDPGAASSGLLFSTMLKAGVLND